MKTICGHERDVVRLGIQILALSDNATVYADQIERDHNATGRIKSVTRDLDDPAKLTELLAEALRERGVDVGGAPPADRRPYNVFHGADLVGIVDWSRSNKATYSSAFASGAATMWDMPQARVALLRVLSLPEGATADDAVREVEAA
jgi:hypothetical protein